MKIPKLIIAAAALATAASTQAAPIIWGAPQNISGNTDVSLNGSLIAAFNVGDTGVSAATLNGVTFQSFVVPNGIGSPTVGNLSISAGPTTFSDNTLFGLAVAPFSTLSSGYQTFLGSGMYQGLGFTLLMSGLNVGTQYEFEWWSNKSNSAQASTTATAGNTVSLLTRNPNSPGALGQFSLGTFTADVATESIAFSGSIATLNGFQIRQVPEPSL